MLIKKKNLATSGPVKARSKFYKFPWVPPLLHSDHNARRFDSFERGALPTWKAKRPSRIKRLGSGAQRMRRLTFYRFSQTMSSMGTFWKNDSCTGNEAINWPKFKIILRLCVTRGYAVACRAPITLMGLVPIGRLQRVLQTLRRHLVPKGVRARPISSHEPFYRASLVEP